MADLAIETSNVVIRPARRDALVLAQRETAVERRELVVPVPPAVLQAEPANKRAHVEEGE